jgi:hypothetical protein
MTPSLTKKLIGGNEVRVFSDASLQASVDRVLATLPDEAKGAVVAHATLEGASLSVVAKSGTHWTVVASGYRSWDGKLKGEADVRYAW